MYPYSLAPNIHVTKVLLHILIAPGTLASLRHFEASARALEACIWAGPRRIAPACACMWPATEVALHLQNGNK